jgi:uncharacterized membrane protein (UPF0127 family)
MWRIFPWVIGLAALAGGLGCDHPAAPTSASPPAAAAPTDFSPTSVPTQAQARLQTIKLYLGAQVLDTELALTGRQMQTGMMFRTNMEEQAGMLFVFPTPQHVGFWMKNTLVPLSAAYIDGEGTIREIHPLQPQDTNSVESSSSEIQYVLEVNQGWFERRNIAVGTVLRTDRGSLRETFFRRP